MNPLDTSDAAQRAQFDAFGNADGATRTKIAFDLSETVFEISRAGIAARHPEYDPESIHLALFRMLHGDRVFGSIWPGTPLPAL